MHPCCWIKIMLSVIGSSITRPPYTHSLETDKQLYCRLWLQCGITIFMIGANNYWHISFHSAKAHFPCAVQIRCCGKTPIRIIVLRLGGNMNHYFSWILTGLIYFLLILHLYCGTKHFVMKHQVISPLWRRTKTCCNALPESDASVTCYTAHSIIFLH